MMTILSYGRLAHEFKRLASTARKKGREHIARRAKLWRKAVMRMARHAHEMLPHEAFIKEARETYVRLMVYEWVR